jgi:hypothetical protein
MKQETPGAVIPRAGGSVIILASAFLLLLLNSAQAREGFYLGAGFASQSLSVGLDGEEGFINADGTVAILAGKPGTGAGLPSC